MTAKARITCVISSLGSGGAERNMVYLASHLREAGYSVTLLTMDDAVDDFFQVPSGVSRLRLISETYKMTCRWFDVKCQVSRWKHLRRQVLATRPDIVISFMDEVNIQVLISLAGSGVPVVVSVRTEPRRYPISWRWNLLRTFAYALAFRVVFNSRAVTEWARRKRPWWRGQWIPNPIFFEGGRNEARSASSTCATAEKIIFALGRLSEEKGFDWLIEAFSRLAARHPTWQVKIIGDGPLREYLLQLIDIKGLKGRVHLLGRVFPPFDLLRGGDLFVLSSRFEGFPNALLEAMACGLPAVSFDCLSGPSEIIRQGVDGLLVTEGDVGALEGAMERMMLDDDERARMARNAPDVLERFSKQRAMSLWDGLIGQALAVRLASHGQS